VEKQPDSNARGLLSALEARELSVLTEEVCDKQRHFPERQAMHPCNSELSCCQM